MCPWLGRKTPTITARMNTMIRATTNSSTRVMPGISGRLVCLVGTCPHKGRQVPRQCSKRESRMVAASLRSRHAPKVCRATANPEWPWRVAQHAKRRFLNYPEFQRLQDRARAVAHAELGKNVGNMVLHRAFRHLQRIGDFLVAVAAGHQAQDFGFTIGQGVGLAEA